MGPANVKVIHAHEFVRAQPGGVLAWKRAKRFSSRSPRRPTAATGSPSTATRSAARLRWNPQGDRDEAKPMDVDEWRDRRGARGGGGRGGRGFRGNTALGPAAAG